LTCGMKGYERLYRSVRAPFVVERELVDLK
jgi:hypothetical protein